MIKECMIAFVAFVISPSVILAQDSKITIREVPLMASVIINRESSKDRRAFQLKSGKLAQMKYKDRVIFRPNGSTMVGQMDTFFMVQKKDTSTYILKSVNPVFKIQFDYFDPHAGRAMFLYSHPPSKISASIQGLTYEELEINSILLRKSTFCLFHKDNLIKTYEVDKSNLLLMIDDLRRSSRADDFISLSRVEILINDKLFAMDGYFFGYVLK